MHRTSSSTGLQLAVNLAQFWHFGASIFQWSPQTYLRADTSMPRSTPSWQCGQVALGLASSHPLRLSQTASHPKAYLHVRVPSPRFSCSKDMSFHRFWIHHFYPGLFFEWDWGSTWGLQEIYGDYYKYTLVLGLNSLTQFLAPLHLEQREALIFSAL